MSGEDDFADTEGESGGQAEVKVDVDKEDNLQCFRLDKLIYMSCFDLGWTGYLTECSASVKSWIFGENPMLDIRPD